MSSPISEQPLEWVYPLTLSGMYLFKDFIGQFVIGIPMMIFFVLIPPSILISICLFCVALVILFVLFGKKPTSRTLRVSHQMISLIDTTTFGTKERRMPAAGAKLYAVHLDFFDRLFTFDLYRTASVYHVEISHQIGETFLFPCNDAREQHQILKQITQLLQENR